MATTNDTLTDYRTAKEADHGYRALAAQAREDLQFAIRAHADHLAAEAGLRPGQKITIPVFGQDLDRRVFVSRWFLAHESEDSDPVLVIVYNGVKKNGDPTVADWHYRGTGWVDGWTEGSEQ